MHFSIFSTFPCLLFSCADTTNPSLPECDDELPEYHAVCRTALTRSSTSVFDKCDVDPINIDTCQADICPHVNNETAVQEVICETIRRAMKVECDAMDLKPDNLPEYCKRESAFYGVFITSGCRGRYMILERRGGGGSW